MANYNKNTGDYGPHGHDKTIFEVQMHADQYGRVISPSVNATSAFGEPISVQLTPIIQLDAIYDLDPREFQIFEVNGGEAESVGSLWKVHTNTAAYAYSVLRSNRVVRYRPGQGCVGRFTAYYDNPQAGVELRAGLFTVEQALQIGYNGTEFGILRENGGKAHIHKFTVTSGGTGNVTIELNDVEVVVAINSTDTTVVAKTLADATYAGWTTEQVDNTVTFIYQQLGPLAGAFSYDGTGTATHVEIQPGVLATKNWTLQEDWNHDKLDGTGPSRMLFDPSKMNVFQVDFRWLGAGIIRWSIEDSNTGNFIPIHIEYYTNRHTNVHIDNPSFRIGYSASNLTGNTITDSHVAGASMMAAIQGIDNDHGFPTTTSSTKTSLGTGSAHCLLSLKSATFYKDKIDLRKVKLKRISVAVQANDPVIVSLVLNGAKSVGHTWNKVANFSGVIKDTSTGTLTLASEHVADSFVVPINGNFGVTYGSDMEISIPPGSWLDIVVTSGQTIQSAAMAVTWVEI